MLKLVLVSQTKCPPCTVLKNQINDRIEEFEELECEFSVVNLDGLEDKDTFIAKHRLTSTPSVWLEEDGVKVFEHSGYIDVDELIKTIGGIK